MKKVFLSFIALSILSFTFAQSDLSKDDIKRIKKELKNYKKNPSLYADMLQGHKDDIADLDEELEKNRKSLEEKKQELSAADQEILSLNNQVSDAQITIEELNDKLRAKEQEMVCGKMPTGTTYRVQIGLYNEFKISSDVQSDMKFLLQENIDGSMRYSLGNFVSLEEAKQFQADMKTMGIRDAFISEYYSGTRNMDFDALNF